jgi:glycosyltransferase involved in cell wall biosynthesis
MPSPEISILMTAWNAERYLCEAIESVLQQHTERSWELVFVDDGSTDGTLAIVKEYATRLPDKIRVLQHSGGANRGISASRNLAMRNAKGSLLAFLDSDDVWLPNHLETQADLLYRMPDVAMVYASAERWVEFSKPFNEQEARNADWGRNFIPPLVPPNEHPGLVERGRLVEWFCADESFVPCICTVMVRESAARAVGGFCDEFTGLYDDQAFHTKIASHFDVFANDSCTARYRQHAESCCGRAREFQEEAKQAKREFGIFLHQFLELNDPAFARENSEGLWQSELT